MKIIIPLYALIIVLAGCAVPAVPADNGSYQRGSTEYKAGKLTVTQPNLSTTPRRSVEGIRVAGPDTDLVVGYWDTLLSESNDALFVFEIFRSRYKDLEVYESGASEAALSEFRRWATNRGNGTAFERYWNR